MKNTDRGFTLIELLIVIAIIGILASVVLAALNSARDSAQDARRTSDIKEIQKALELFYNDNGVYPETPPTNGLTSTLVSEMTTGEYDITPYISQIPRDPKHVGTTYDYRYRRGDATRQSYTLLVRLDKNTTSPYWCSVSTNPGFVTWNGTVAPTYYYTPCQF